MCGAAATQGGSHFWETERENFPFRCRVIPSYLVPSLSTVQKYPGPETTGDFRGKKGSGDEALIIVCVSLSLLSHQGQSQRAGVGPLDSWKVLPIKHLRSPIYSGVFSADNTSASSSENKRRPSDYSFTQSQTQETINIV